MWHRIRLTPYLQYTFIHEGIKENNAANRRRKPLDYLQAGYTWLLTRCFRHPRLTLMVPQRMMPLEERDQFAVEIFMPNGTTVQRTAEVTDSLEHILKRDKRVTAVTSFIGQGSPRFNVTYAPQIGGTNLHSLL